MYLGGIALFVVRHTGIGGNCLTVIFSTYSQVRGEVIRHISRETNANAVTYCPKLTKWVKCYCFSCSGENLRQVVCTKTK